MLFVLYLERFGVCIKCAAQICSICHVNKCINNSLAEWLKYGNWKYLLYHFQIYVVRTIFKAIFISELQIFAVNEFFNNIIPVLVINKRGIECAINISSTVCGISRECFINISIIISNYITAIGIIPIKLEIFRVNPGLLISLV